MMMKRSFFVLIWCLFAFVAFAQINVRDSIQTILQNDTLDPRIRFINAYNVVFFNSSPEEAEYLGLNVIYPFVQKTWERKSDQLHWLSRLHLLTSFVHRERGGDNKDEKERFFMEKAVRTAIESKNDTALARSFNSAGFMEMNKGDIKKAHEYLYQAVHYYDKIGLYTKASEMLNVIVVSFLEIKDTDGMYRVLQQMKDYLEKDTSKQSQYQYNVVSHHYYDLLLEKEKNVVAGADVHVRTETIDSMFLYIRKNIDLVENYLGELSPFWMHGYAYYYLAKALDDYFHEQHDSILFYLDKAVDMMKKEVYSLQNETAAGKELTAKIGLTRAKTVFRQGNMREAYKVMNEVLMLLDELKNSRNVSEQRRVAYQFMVDYYEKTNNFARAFKFQKLISESEAERYESDKIQAINDMSVKYETEKKEIQIQTLIKEKETARRILWLTFGLSFALLVVSFLIILSSRLKRKNVEQRLYETALQAELHQSELERVQSAKQQLEQNPVKISVEKIALMVSVSLIEKDTKTAYLERLSKIDFQPLENAYQSSKVKITAMDMKYIICFAADLDAKDISLLFNIEPASVHTVRYRIKKKFAKEDLFRVIL